ncbi:hypothetical protein PVAND_008512 [Polypedilum vanderplanki]|uniref:Core Histone H2A/H2B/H3 domain-containing protein n=1 Tax=Polypedilum vanderplanki TaxID=319348 RepID=A0A9J6C9S2_POLVA|nr:hypothetical protein PVAND_008512 [Polypedilum vanderplanki]
MIFRVFRCIHPDMKLSEKAINVLNSFVNDFFDKFALEASFLVKRISKRNTMTDFDIQSAAKLILSGDLKEYAIVEGRKALESFKSHQNMNHNLSYEKYFSFKADINFRRTSSPQQSMF